MSGDNASFDGVGAIDGQSAIALPCVHQDVVNAGPAVSAASSAFQLPEAPRAEADLLKKILIDAMNLLRLQEKYRLTLLHARTNPRHPLFGNNCERLIETVEAVVSRIRVLIDTTSAMITDLTAAATTPWAQYQSETSSRQIYRLIEVRESINLATRSVVPMIDLVDDQDSGRSARHAPIILVSNR